MVLITAEVSAVKVLSASQWERDSTVSRDVQVATDELLAACKAIYIIYLCGYIMSCCWYQKRHKLWLSMPVLHVFPL